MRPDRTTLFSLLSLAATAMASGVVVHNHCDFPVHSCTVSQDQTNFEAVIQPGERHYEPFVIPPSVDGSFGGTSMKLGKVPGGAGPITQLEYTWAEAGIAPDMFWYDISDVNCGPTSQSSTGDCPFINGGMHVRVKHNQECPRRICKGGDLQCQFVYYLPHDDQATAGCRNGNRDDLVMHLCQDHTRFTPGFRIGTPAKHPRDFHF